MTGARTGWQAWSAPQASAARERYGWRAQRLQHDALTRSEQQPSPDKRSVVEAALARARAGRAS